MAVAARLVASVKREVGAALFRRKHFDESDVTQTKLSRCLSLLDLTAIGVGSTLGAGIYVVAGEVARNTAGPSVVLSFVIAGVASVMAGLCYAEFGARVPKTGSAYVYSYVAVGEFVAFIIGWNMLLEYVIGTASVARALSEYINSLTNDAISSFFKSYVTIWLSDETHVTIDLVAFAVVVLLTIVLCVGVRESTLFNNLFTTVNLFVVAYVTICGFFKYDIGNWSLPSSSVPQLANNSKCETVNADKAEPCYGVGGFFPFGISGTLSGAATCFYAFVGFDVIATAGEEVTNPQRNIPLAIVLCLSACSLAYFGVSATITLISPYFELDAQTPLTAAFTFVGWSVATYVISGGAICALSASLLAGLLPLPRVIFAMAEDGLIFRWLSMVHPRTRTPLLATALSGLLAALMGALFDLQALVDMMSIGTLLAYAIVALSVTLLRYGQPLFTNSPLVNAQLQPEVELDASSCSRAHNADVSVASGAEKAQLTSVSDQTPTTGKCANEPQNDAAAGLFEWSVWYTLLFTRSVVQPNATSSRYVSWLCILFSLLTVTMCVLLVSLGLSSPLGIATFSVLVFCCVLLALLISRMPQSHERVYFKVPLVPFLPCLSVFVNLYLMSKLSYETWLRFAVWMAVGLSIYFGYGVLHSSERAKLRRHNPSQVQNDH